MKSCGAGRRQFRGRSPSLRTCLFCHPKSVILWGFSPEGSGVQQLTCGPAAVAVHTKCLFIKFRMTPAHAHQLGADASRDGASGADYSRSETRPVQNVSQLN